MTSRLRPLTLAALVGVALIGAGCGSDAPSDAGSGTSAAVSGSSDTTSTSGGDDGAGGGTSATTQAKLVKLAECIRAHGVPHFPDPDPKGETNFGIDVSPAVWKKATEACKSITPPGTFSGKRSPKQQSAALRFAACVREHGVKDFPDPVNGDPLIDTTKIPSSNKPGGMTILNAATHQCGAILGRAAGGQR